MGHHRAWVRQCGRFYAPYKVHQKKEIISAGSRRFPDRLGDMTQLFPQASFCAWECYNYYWYAALAH